MPEKQAELAALQDARFRRLSELPSYIRELQDLGGQSGVTFTSLTPAAPAPLGGTSTAGEALLPPDTLAAINVDIVVTGGYFEIVDFMNELETASRYTLVSGYTIARWKTESAEACHERTSLTATLNARIYLVPSARDHWIRSAERRAEPGPDAHRAVGDLMSDTIATEPRQAA